MWIICCLSQMNQRWWEEQNLTIQLTHTHTHIQDPHATHPLSTPSSLLMLSKRALALPHPTLCRLRRYIGYFIEDTQTSESVSTSRSAISKAALTWGGHHYFSSLSLVLYFFFSGAPRLSPTELISWSRNGARVSCPHLSHRAAEGMDGHICRHQPQSYSAATAKSSQCVKEHWPDGQAPDQAAHASLSISILSTVWRSI